MYQQSTPASPFERVCQFLLTPWGFILFTGLTLLSYFFWDKPTALLMHQLQITDPYRVMHYIGFSYKSLVCFVVILSFGLCFRYILHRKLAEMRTWFVLLCLSAATIVCSALKMFLGRARPILWFEHQQYGFYGFTHDKTFLSFPSGHTMTAMSITFALSILFPKHGYLLMIVGLLFSFLRVVMLNHYLSDILVGIYLAVVCVWAVRYFVTKHLVGFNQVFLGYKYAS